MEVSHELLTVFTRVVMDAAAKNGYMWAPTHAVMCSLSENGTTFHACLVDLSTRTVGTPVSLSRNEVLSAVDIRTILPKSPSAPDYVVLVQTSGPKTNCTLWDPSRMDVHRICGHVICHELER